MKTVFYIFLTLITANILSSQTGTILVKKNEIDLVGIWTLTNYNKPDKFSDTWELKSNGIFNQLKYLTDTSTVLLPDENGTWEIVNATLKITITNENGKNISKPQILTFQIKQEGESFKLDFTFDSNLKNQTPMQLRLTRKKTTTR